MVESLVITLREGVEAALVVGIILAYLRKIDRVHLSQAVYFGLGLAILASIGAAIAFQTLNIDPENEFLEGTLLGTAGLLVATMVIWMWRAARSIRSEMESKIAGIVGRSEGQGGAGAIGLLLFTFVMVFREGMETVLFLFAATLGEFDLLSLTGSVLGVGLAVLFAVLLIKGSVRINLSRFFSVTSFILLLLALRLLLGSAHEFAEVGVLPMSKELMSFIGVFVRDSSTMLIMIALLAAPVFMILWDASSNERNRKVLGAANVSSAERRKGLAASRRERVWRIALVVAALSIISAMGSTVFAVGKAIDPAPILVEARGDLIEIPLARLPEGELQKFAYDVKGVQVRFIAMRHADGSVHAGFDACQICGSAGYMQEGEHAVCKNCNAPILASTIGEGGGCNPLPLTSRVVGGAEGEVLTIPTKALAETVSAFSK